jgi:four helix bundle protein
MKIDVFEDSPVWKDARVLAQKIFEQTQRDGFYKDFSLKDQINRAIGSVMDNIAEGFERNGNKELIQFLSIAKGSAGEVRSQLYRAKDRGYLTADEFDKTIEHILDISKQLSGLISYLKRSDMKGSKFFQEPQSPES